MCAAFLRGRSQETSEPKAEVIQLRSPAISASQQKHPVLVQFLSQHEPERDYKEEKVEKGETILCHQYFAFRGCL